MLYIRGIDMEMMSFKERVKNAAIANAPIYEENFIKYEYLVCSKAYNNDYHILKADKSNYLHLIGIHTGLKAEHFFEKCMAAGKEQLKESDFDFMKAGKDEKEVKGSVRKKIDVLPKIKNFFNQPLFTEEGFKKNSVNCAFATSDNCLTLGFVKEGRPKTLLKSNKLDRSRQKEVDLIFRKPRGSTRPYAEIVYGDVKKIELYKESIQGIVDKKLFFNN